MLTQSDIKKLRDELKKDFVTKKEMQEMFNNFSKEIIDFMSPSLKKIDEIYSELKDVNDDIDDHERRIEKIEEKVYTTTTTS